MVTDIILSKGQVVILRGSSTSGLAEAASTNTVYFGYVYNVCSTSDSGLLGMNVIFDSRGATQILDSSNPQAEYYIIEEKNIIGTELPA